MKRILVLPFLSINLYAFAQFSQAERDSINKGTQADYLLMLEQLGISRTQISTSPNWIAWACRYWGDCKYD